MGKYDNSIWKLLKHKIFDISDYPIKAQGTTNSDGVQYGDEVVTIDADTDYELLLWKSEDYYENIVGNLAWVHYNIVFYLKAGSVTADLKWKLQARNKDSTWTDMCAEKIETNIGTDYMEKRIKGYLDIKTNIKTTPFEMRLIFQSNEATPGVGTSKVKNDTIIRMQGRII